MDVEMNSTVINYDLHRYPFCLVWTPIPLLTWLFPFVGHLGIATSEGIIRDFAGPYFVSEDNMGFGWPTRYLELDINKVEGGRSSYDDAVIKASNEYQKRMHNLFWDNCHSHCGMALSLMRYKDSTSWNMIKIAIWMNIFGKYVGFWGFVKTWLPFAVVVTTVICLFQANEIAGSLETFQDHRCIAELINFCSGVEVLVNDNFPQIVCRECLLQIVTACRIKEICIRSDESLRMHSRAFEEQLSNQILGAAVKIETEPDIFKIESLSSVVKEEPFDNLEEMCVVDTPIDFDFPRYDPMQSYSPEEPRHQPERRSKYKLASARSKREPLPATFKCYLCKEDFVTRKAKYEHLEFVHCNSQDFKCRICKHKSQTARGIDNHLMLHENPELLSHMCHICSKNYQKACELRRHIKLSHSDKSMRVSKFFCDFCDFKTFSKMNVKRHLRTIHLKIKAFQCEHCPDKKYTSKVTLDQHNITKHGQETDYVCRCCGRKFPTMSFLRSHMKSTCSGSPGAVRERGDPNEYREHIGSEHYRCKICSVIVEGKGKIAQHYAQRHKHSNACELCTATFNSYSNLKKHIQILHNKIHKFECSFCGKRFGQKNQLQSHENTHTGAKPFGCKFDFCQFRSGDLSAISKHQKKCAQNPNNMG